MSERPVIQIDCGNVTSENGFWDAYLSSTRAVMADSFGRNFDALWDAVESSDPGPGYPGEVDLRFENCRQIRPLSGGKFLGVLQTIAADVTQRSIELVD